MVAGEDIGCDVGIIFGLKVAALMRGAFEAHVDESDSELRFPSAVINEGLHVEFDFAVDVFDGQYLFKN